jgi:hypothetical protein
LGGGLGEKSVMVWVFEWVGRLGAKTETLSEQPTAEATDLHSVVVWG